VFCARCGMKLQDGAFFCSRCGHPVSGTASSQQSLTYTGAIWNPDAAANWSLLLSPAFGSYLHALNWRTLGEPEKARTSMRWFYLSIALPVVLASVPQLSGEAISGMGLLYFFLWYFITGWAQARYVIDKLGSSYPRRGWGLPLIIAFLVVAGILACYCYSHPHL